ncbi:MAG: alpha amylase C-terminal domain-containing protein, partial [Oscillospiraceae bacterium]|nr:alpha amylase C-terminal domain-containing protein [Oscillospiraceae bacterium]
PVVCVCNFTPVAYDGFLIGLPAAGRLKPLLSSDEKRFGGYGKRGKIIRSKKGSFREFENIAYVPLPPLSAQYFQFEEVKKKS